MGSEELILYRLDELKGAIVEVKEDIRAGRAETAAFREEHAKLEHRVDVLETTAAVTATKAGQMSGGITGGAVGAVVAVIAGVIEWMRSRA